ncbi:hypothetical protein [Solimonas sp. K1W22B-7]|nr:hypothetical protein [Solimonas sp. K1W22B-7]
MNLKDKLAKPVNPYTQPNATPDGTRKSAGVRKAYCETKTHQKK